MGFFSSLKDSAKNAWSTLTGGTPPSKLQEPQEKASKDPPPTYDDTTTMGFFASIKDSAKNAWSALTGGTPPSSLQEPQEQASKDPPPTYDDLYPAATFPALSPPEPPIYYNPAPSPAFDLSDYTSLFDLLSGDLFGSKTPADNTDLKPPSLSNGLPIPPDDELPITSPDRPAAMPTPLATPTGFFTITTTSTRPTSIYTITVNPPPTSPLSSPPPSTEWTSCNIAVGTVVVAVLFLPILATCCFAIRRKPKKDPVAVPPPSPLPTTVVVDSVPKFEPEDPEAPPAYTK